MTVQPGFFGLSWLSGALPLVDGVLDPSDEVGGPAVLGAGVLVVSACGVPPSRLSSTMATTAPMMSTIATIETIITRFVRLHGGSGGCWSYSPKPWYCWPQFGGGSHWPL